MLLKNHLFSFLLVGAIQFCGADLDASPEHKAVINECCAQIRALEEHEKVPVALIVDITATILEDVVDSAIDACVTFSCINKMPISVQDEVEMMSQLSAGIGHMARLLDIVSLYLGGVSREISECDMSEHCFGLCKKLFAALLADAFDSALGSRGRDEHGSLTTQDMVIVLGAIKTRLDYISHQLAERPSSLCSE